jgi:glucose/arabinose dehydrogenase/cytochrome c551/c552
MRPRCWTGAVIVLVVGIGQAPVCAGPENARREQAEVEPEDLPPGLIAQYRSLTDKSATLHRIDAKPAFHLGLSSPHPRIPAGPFAVDWTGMLYLKDAGPITFDAFVSGDVSMEVDGVPVLEGRAETEASRVGPGKPLDRPSGLYRVAIHYRSLPDRPARLQIWWQGATFAHEPLPAWLLKHRAEDVPPTVVRELLAEKGYAAVGRLGCARCHRSAFPGVVEPPPGPSMANVRQRISRAWLLDWLAAPAKVRNDARMPALFSAGRTGFVERWIIAEHMLGPTISDKQPAPSPSQPANKKDERNRAGDHRLGRRAFVSLGCPACHFLPDVPRAEQPDQERVLLSDLGDRLPAEELAAFLGNPQSRYPDGRMPRLPVTPDAARDIAAYLLLWSKPGGAHAQTVEPPTVAEIRAVTRRLSASDIDAAGAALVRQKGCAACHSGLGAVTPSDIPLTAADPSRGCLSGKSVPRFTVDTATREAIAAYQAVATQEKHPSPFAARQRLIAHLGCVRCHQRDSDRPPPIEAIGSTLGSAWLQEIPFQRTPRLTYPHQKYTRQHLLATVREGVTGLRPARYTYRMPAFGHDADAIVQALAEGDGDLPAGPEPPSAQPADPTLGSLTGPRLAGFQGYSCLSCHMWNGKMLSEPDPGAVGTDLTRVAGRLRRDWFDRFLEGPARFHPNTPMPAIFFHGKPATLTSVLDGDAIKQKEALWSYFALGTKAPSPKPQPPVPAVLPQAGEPPLVAQIPIRLPNAKTVESITLLYNSHDLITYDVGSLTLHSGYTGAQILRDVQGRLRTFSAAGKPIGVGFQADSPLQLLGDDKAEVPTKRTLHGCDRLTDGVRIRWQAQFAASTVEAAETLRLATDGKKRRLLREFRFTCVPESRSIELRTRVPGPLAVEVSAAVGEAKGTSSDGIFCAVLTPNKEHAVQATIRYELPEPASPPPVERTVLTESAKGDGTLERPGYRAIAYPRPKTSSGEDRVMPAALAVDPRDGRVFVASMKTGEIFVVRDPTGDGRNARFDNYAHGLFQETLSMLAEPGVLYVLHRRNLTRLSDTDGDGFADRFDRVAALPHGVADTYDYGYGLVRDKSGAFVFTYAPYANTNLPGSGSALRLVPGKEPQEIAFGFRNPLGWCTGPDGDVFFTDNQGEWVATNKLCHLVEGRFYGFPNPAQRQHATKPPGKTAVWVPYGWAKSINGVAYDNSGGKFGPFTGQFFLAELMFGGGIVRASLEKVNGEYQGACFPFWGPGLLGPLTLAFDPKGRLWAGGITEPGWMAQPDRGALFRIDYTGDVPFEMQTIHVRPRGFRIVFTRPVSPETARDVASYAIEHYRYEYTGAYGSPELDRTGVTLKRVELASDGRSVDVTTASLLKDRVYLIQARGVRSAKGEPLVHAVGAYTLNEIPAEKP